MSEPARRRSLAALGQSGGGFARDARYAPAPERAAIAPDPVADAYARGHADGVMAGSQAERAHSAQADAARHRIESALAAIDEAHTAAFAARLNDTVLALCSTVLAEAAIAPDGLIARVATAAAMFNRASDDRVIRMHPDDLALVHGRLPDAWHCEPDGMLERGAVRVESASGGVEQGPAQWRAALEEALRAC